MTAPCAPFPQDPVSLVLLHGTRALHRSVALLSTRAVWQQEQVPLSAAAFSKEECHSYLQKSVSANAAAKRCSLRADQQGAVGARGSAEGCSALRVTAWTPAPGAPCLCVHACLFTPGMRPEGVSVQDTAPACWQHLLCCGQAGGRAAAVGAGGAAAVSALLEAWARAGGGFPMQGGLQAGGHIESVGSSVLWLC